MNKREERFLPIEIRAEMMEDRVAELTGYPIVFEQEIDMRDWREVIDAGAIGDGNVLRDVALMIGHNFGSIPLAHSRRNNGSATMQLTPDDYGVKMRASLDTDENPRAKEAYSAVRRGDMTGMSFAFVVSEEKWEDLDSEKPLRRITGFSKILEVSLVAFPAYPGTTVQAASEGEALESVRASLESARKQLAEDRERKAEHERRMAAMERLEKLQKEVRA